MPGRLFLTRSAAEIADALGLAEPPPPQLPRFNMAPGQEVLVITAGGPRMMRWGLIPSGRRNARGRPVMEVIVNARSETLFEKSAFEGLGRAVVPADGWYEWTGRTGRKTAHRITAADGSLLLFAAVTDTWVAPGGREVPQVATVTCAPSADVRDIHDRMGVLLRPGDVATWIAGPKDAARRLMVPWPDGSLTVGPADGVDWSGT